MTAPNLTPAEALECLRDLHEDGKSLAAWDAKWKRLRVYGMTPCIRAIAALETLLSEHEATKAKLAAYEARPTPMVRVENGRIIAAVGNVEIVGGCEEPAAAAPACSHGEPPDAVKIAEWPVLSNWARHTRDQIDKLGAAVASHRDLPHPLGQFSTESTIDFACRLLEERPAAAVPSDEEIRKAIYMAKNMPQPAWTVSAIELVCQRIGVKL